MSKGKVIELNKQPRRILITHTDLDGLGCAIILTKCFPNLEVYFSEANDSNETVMEIIAEKKNRTVPIIITDLSVNEEVAELLNARMNVDLIDHHPTAKWLTDKYPWALVDTTYCATRLTYNIYSQGFLLSDYEELVMMTDNYDRWGEGQGPTDYAKDLSRLVYILGRERFYERFVRVSSIEFAPIELALLELDKEKELRYIQESIPMVTILNDGTNTPYGLLAADQYLSVLGNELLKAIPGIEYIVMLDYRTDKASLRSRGNTDVGELAKQVGGGGHKKAAGFPLSQAASRMFLGCNGSCEHTDKLMNEVMTLRQLGDRTISGRGVQ